MSGNPVMSTISRPWAVNHWLANGVLDSMAEINAQCIELLSEMADGATQGLPLLECQLPLWRSLSAGARMRLAGCPYLLVDAGFGDPLRWERIARQGVSEQPLEWQESCFKGERASCFARGVLVYGWYLARSHGAVARLALGMAPACLQAIGALSLLELDGVCERYPGWIRPRWESQPLVWRQILSAAVRDDRAAFQQAGLHGMQLLAAAAAGAALG
jgi:hypothetical protein